MPSNPKRAVRLAIAHFSAATTIFLAGAAAVSRGWVIRGLILMAIAVLYLIYELVTSKPISKNVPEMIRLLIALFAIVIFLGFNEQTIKGFFRTAPPAPPKKTIAESTPTPPASPTPTPAKTLTAAEIAKELAKLNPPKTGDSEIIKLRSEAISVINGLNGLYRQWEKRDHSLQGQLIGDATDARQRTVQYLRNSNNQEVSDKYFRDYHERAIGVRNSLLGHIPHTPTGRDDRADDSYFPLQGRTTMWSTNIVTQTCDLIKLLNEMESEHGLPMSVSDIRQSLFCH